MYARRSVVPALYTLLQWPDPSAPGADRVVALCQTKKERMSERLIAQERLVGMFISI